MDDLCGESTRERAQSFAKFMSRLPPEEIARVNELNRKEATEQHKQFREAFKAGRCSFCGDALTAFDATKPCRHWFLKPEGTRKEHIEQVDTQLSWDVLENYLRWVANEETFAAAAAAGMTSVKYRWRFLVSNACALRTRRRR